MKLSLGPIQYFWNRAAVFDFYDRAADAPVDIVYLGEVVCAKRRALKPEDWLLLAARLAAAGKEVVLSTQALIEAESELGALRRLCGNGIFDVEANDMGAVNLLRGTRFVIGPHVNVYNAQTLALLTGLGARRWVMPVELGRAMLEALAPERPADVEIELFAYGRLPLAFSARCFTARAHNLPKDDCGFRCADYPAGMLLETREAQPFLALNGIQVQSAATGNLLPHVAEAAALGVDVLRISPQATGTFEAIAAFRSAFEETAAEPMLPPPLPGGYCDGYWRGGAGMAGAA
jgi:collagenase-like PrtC family protease